MRISTCIAAYNAERYVAAALDSVLTQSLRPHEIIVVDDGSTDGTAAVLSGFGARIRLIRQENHGPAHALNRAIAEATGDAFAFLDADDLWLAGKLRLQHDVLAGEPGLEAVFGHMRQFLSPELDPAAARRYAVPEGVQPGIHKNALLIRRSAFERIGRFDEALTVSDFVDWYARANVLGLRSRMLPDVVALRRHHAGNATRLLRPRVEQETLQALKRSVDLRRGR
jgi:glycosyltransferase involved in cell wall biosynthesis